MPTIKIKKEMNLPQLIEWGWKNEIKKRSFISNDGKVTANFEDTGQFITDNFISSDVTFTVEIEEEITGDTVIPRILEIGVGNLSGYSAVKENVSVNRIINKKNKYIYIIDDDYAITPFYRKGKLVE